MKFEMAVKRLEKTFPSTLVGGKLLKILIHGKELLKFESSKLVGFFVMVNWVRILPAVHCCNIARVSIEICQNE